MPSGEVGHLTTIFAIDRQSMYHPELLRCEINFSDNKVNVWGQGTVEKQIFSFKGKYYLYHIVGYN